jgi:serine/threonine-protein kinase
MDDASGRYKIEREIGRGGMARVYLAHDIRHNRPVALKLLHRELGAAIGAERFHREIQVIARLRHPHIVPLYDSGEMSGQLFYVMPFVAGETVRQRIARSGQFAPDEAMRLASDVADALEYAHRNGVVHRDIKPDNIMIDERHALVMDFGIARALADGVSESLTGTGLLVGTPAYMSPEQVTGDAAIDGRSDIYSLGCVIYEMLSGSPPFAGPNPQAVMARRFSAATPSLDSIAAASPEVQRVVTRAMTLSVADRYQSASEMLTDLEMARGSTPASGTLPLASSPKLPRKRSQIWIAAVVTAAVLVAAFALSQRKRIIGRPTAASGVQVASIGVLPFANQSGDKQLEYFSDGLTDELISSLSRLRGLQVAGRASSFSLKGKGLDAHEAASRLNVAYLIDAGVRSGGSRVRVNWQLIDGKSGNVVRSGDLDGDTKDVISLQDSMAKQIAAGLEPVIGRSASGLVGRHQTTNYEAHDLYLKGHFYWNQRTAATMRQGIDYLKQAIAKDSTYALAWAELSSAYTIEPTFGDMSPAETIPAARDAAKKALELDPDLAEANTAMGMSLTVNDWMPSAALPYLDKAILLDPQNSFPHLFRVWPLVMLGRFDEAYAESKKARSLDQLSPILNTRVGTTLIYGQRYPEAEAELKRVITADPSNIIARFEYAVALAGQGKFAKSFAAFPDAIDVEAGNSTANHAWAYYRAGMKDSARIVFNKLLQRSRQRYVTAAALSMAAASAGDTVLGTRYLRDALAEHSFFLAFIGQAPAFDALRSTAEYGRVVHEVQKNFR